MRRVLGNKPCTRNDRHGWLGRTTRPHRRSLDIATNSQSNGSQRDAAAPSPPTPRQQQLKGILPASPPSAATTAHEGASSQLGTDFNSLLLQALAEQFRREALPWIQDLVEPWIQGPPPPLTDTVPPEQLADRDSRFITVNGVRIHYKMSLPGERESLPAVPELIARSTAGPGPAGNRAATTIAEPAAASASGRKWPFWSPAQAGWSNTSALNTSSSLSAGPAAVATAGPDLPPNPDAAPTLLLMHGLNGSTFNWRLLMDDLAAYVSPSTGGCRVIAYDRPPYGLSQRPLDWQSDEDNPYTVEGGARLASSLLSAVIGSPHPSSGSPPSSGSLPSSGSPPSSGSLPSSGSPPSQSPAWRTRGSAAGRAVLVGHSAGAAVAVETALRYPDQVCGLVLIAPAISLNSRGFLAGADLGQLLRFAWTRTLLSADGPGLNYVRRQVLKRKAQVEEGQLGIYADEREVPQEVIDGYLRPLRAQDWDKGTLLVYRSFQVAGKPQPLEQLRVPVLVLQGREDRTVPMEVAQSVTEALRRRGPDYATEFVVLDRCAHVPMDEQPLEVLNAVVDFINRRCCAATNTGDAATSPRRRDAINGDAATGAPGVAPKEGPEGAAGPRPPSGGATAGNGGKAMTVSVHDHSK